MNTFTDAAINLRELSAAPADRAALAAFYANVYVQEFPDPDERESLDSITDYLQRKASGWYGANNYHVLVAERAGAILGGCIVDYLERPNAGVIEFLFTATGARQRGVGRWLLEQAERVLHGDAQSGGHPSLRLIAAEMNDPYALPDVPDNLDPFVRARIWDGWGFGALDFPYVQPALSAQSRPVVGLVMIAKLFDPPAASVVLAANVALLLAEYLRCAMRIDEPNGNAQYRAMAAWLEMRDTVPWMRLKRLIGEDAPQPFAVHELRDPRSPEFAAAISVYQRAFTTPDVAVQPAAFASVLARPAEEGYRYHLWALRHEASGAIAGMTSFFSFDAIGFGGYVVLEGALRGGGCLPALLARIEQQMCVDQRGVRGWLIECEHLATAVAFACRGFRTIVQRYTPPALPGHATGPASPMRLMYKPLGRVYGPPALDTPELLAGLAQVLQHVYRIAAPEAHPSYLDVAVERAGRASRTAML